MTRRLRLGGGLIAALILVATVAPGAALAAAPASAADIAAAMDIPSGQVVSASLGTSDARGAGTHSGALGAYFPQQGTTFGIISTGAVEDATDPDSNNGETLGGGGTGLDDKSTVLLGLNTPAGEDRVQLTLELAAPLASDCLLFRFAFYSEEFPDFVGLGFNDTFTAELNGSNIAFDTNGDVIDVNTNFGFDPSNPNPNTGTTYDGTTGLLEAAGPVVGGTTNTIVFTVDDLGDSILDTAVFLDYLRFVYTGDQCTPGAQPVDPILTLTPETESNGVRTNHTVAAAVATGPFPVTSQPVVFTVTGTNSATATVLTDAITGIAEFTYSSSVTGNDTITAFLDENGNGTQDAGEDAEDTATKTWTNAPPTIVIDTPTEGELFDLTAGPVNLSATVSDPDAAEVLTCSVDWDDGSSPTTGISGASGTCTDSHTYTVAGVYTVSATVTDLLGLSATDTVMIVVYDPTAGFVTGGGWINSPAGAYAADATLTGRATFGFVSKYHKGASTPSGSTEFQFRAGNLNFHSDSYQWLVVAGARAQYKGTGTINGEPGYSFMLTAIDGALPGGGGSDKFRIKIWETTSGTVVYDNQVGAPDSDDPTTSLGGGNIVIHK